MGIGTCADYKEDDEEEGLEVEESSLSKKKVRIISFLSKRRDEQQRSAGIGQVRCCHLPW